MVNKVLHILTLALTGLALTGCTNDDSNFDELLSQSREEAVVIEFPDMVLAELPDEVPEKTDESYNDYIESFTPKIEVTIDFADGDATVVSTSTAVKVSKTGAHVTADIGARAVRFVLRGDCADGSLRVEGDNRFSIVLDNLRLANPDGAVINNQSSKTLYIHANEGTVNVLESKGGNPEATDAKGCLFSEGQIAFSGAGEVRVKSAFRNAIASDDYVFVRPQCRLEIETTSGNGIKANDGVTVNGGSINILVDYNGGKGINSESFVKVNGGRTTIINNGTTRLDKVAVSPECPQGIDTVNSAAVKADAEMRVTAGELRMKCTGDNSKGVNCKLNYTQTGGQVYVVALGNKVLSSPKAMKTGTGITISGGYFYAYSLHSSALDSDGPIDILLPKRDKDYVIEIKE